MKQVSILFLTFILSAMTVCCNSDNKRTSAQDPMDVYFQEFTEGVKKLTPEQLQDFIKTADIALKRLQKVIESDETNPEERFEAMQTSNHILKERDIILKAL